MTYPAHRRAPAATQARAARQVRRPFARRSRAQGFTLIEVLIAASILLLSMTGLLTAQLLSIKISKNAYHRTQATNLAYQMTDYLRASCASIDTYVGQTLCRSGSRNPNDSRNCDIASSADIADDANSMVDDNLRAWWSAIDEAELPSWFATVQRAGPDLVHVIVQWDDTRATETAADATEAKTSCLGSAIPSPMEEVCLTTDPCGGSV
jgi:type IV pilus assembly protein PilV